MSSKLEKIENNSAIFELTISPEKFEEALKKTFSKNSKKFTVPGFRKGKATRGMIEKYYGESVFYDDAFDIFFPEAYEEAIKTLELDPVARPEVDVVSIGKAEGVVLKINVVVKPEVALGDYKGIEVEKVEYTVSDEDIDKKLEELAKQNARIVDISDRAVKMGDIVLIDFEGYTDDVAFEGGSAVDYKLEVGSGSFIPGFEEQVVGAEIGNEVDVKVTFPENYNSEELAGKPAVFKVTVKEISERQYPEIDDDFAVDVSDFDNLLDLKADLKAKAEEAAALKEKQEYEDKVIGGVVERATVDIPQIMIDQEVDVMLRDFDNQLKYQGLNLENYLKYMNMSFETIREQYREIAVKRVKSQLVMDEVAKTENFDITDEEIELEIAKYAEKYKQSAEDFKKTLKDESMIFIKEGIAVKKAIDLIVNTSIRK